MKQLYETTATAKGGRNGTTSLSDDSLSVDLSMPGSDGTGHNPEQLFAMGYAACFDGALAHVAKEAGENIDSKTTVHASLNEDGEGFSVGARIEVEVSGVSQDKAEELVEKAHQFCPYSKATKGNIDVDLNAKAV